MIRKFHEAKLAGHKKVKIWGTGEPRREFLHVDDLADACLYVMRHWGDELQINIGTGEDLTIRELAETVRDVVYPQAELEWDTSKPDGMMRKRLDVSRLHGLGWAASTRLRRGIELSYRWFLDNVDHVRGMHSVERSFPARRSGAESTVL